MTLRMYLTALFTTFVVAAGVHSLSAKAAATPSPVYIHLYTFADFSSLYLSVKSTKDPGSLLVYSKSGELLQDLSQTAGAMRTTVGVMSDDAESARIKTYWSNLSSRYPFLCSRKLIRLGGSTQKQEEVFEDANFYSRKRNSYVLVITDSGSERYLELIDQKGHRKSINIGSLDQPIRQYFEDPLKNTRRFTLKVSDKLTHKGHEGVVLGLVDHEADIGFIELHSLFIPFSEAAPTVVLQKLKINRYALVSSLKFDSWDGSIYTVFTYLDPREKKAEPIRLSLMSCNDIATHNGSSS